MKNLVGLLLFYASVAFAVVNDSGKTRLEGYVLSFDDKKIILESGNQKIELPKKLYSSKVVIGEKILVSVDQKSFEALKKEKIQK